MVNQNSLNRFLGKPEYLKIDSIGDIPLYALRPRDLVLFKDNATPEEQLNANQEVIKRRCGEEKLDSDGKISFIPFFTDDEIENMDWNTFNQILNKLMEISNLTDKNEQIRRIRESQKQNIQQK